MHRIESVLPEARFVHLVRDGRDVALSVLGMNWGPSTVPEAAFRWKKRILRAREQAPRIGHYVEIRYEDLVRDTEATLRRICEFVDLPYDEEMLRYHEHASERLQEKARDLDRGPDKAPQTAEARLESHALATQPPDPERIERWRTEMSVEDRAVYEELAGDLLADLGYEVEGAPASARSAPSRASGGRAVIPVGQDRADALDLSSRSPRRSPSPTPSRRRRARSRAGSGPARDGIRRSGPPTGSACARMPSR